MQKQFLLLLCALCASVACFFKTAMAKDITVTSDGSGDFTTVQAAVDAVPANNSERVVIHIKPGTYKEKLVIGADKPFVTFKGEGDKPDDVVLTYDWSANHAGPDGQKVGTSGSYSTRVAGHDFVAENVTFQNTAGETGQALAMSADGDRLVFRNCRFLGWQDTLYANGGRQYYGDCYFEGRVDFIFGSATAVFDHCTIHSKAGGHVTAASTPQDHPFGYVFLDCKLTGSDIGWQATTRPELLQQPSTKPAPKATLGRPWRPYAAVAYLRCEMGPHVHPRGWDNWRSVEKEKTARYAEYKCTGPGADRSQRVAWARELSDDEAAGYTVANILAGSDHWSP
jgi:pectinesterase